MKRRYIEQPDGSMDDAPATEQDADEAATLADLENDDAWIREHYDAREK